MLHELHWYLARMYTAGRRAVTHSQEHTDVPAITSKRYEIGCQIIITNKKSRICFRLVTLNDLKRRNSPYFALFNRFPVMAKTVPRSSRNSVYLRQRQP